MIMINLDLKRWRS